MLKFFVFLIISSSLFAADIPQPLKEDLEHRTKRACRKRPISELYCSEYIDSSSQLPPPAPATATATATASLDDELNEDVNYISIDEEDIEYYLQLLANLPGNKSFDVADTIQNKEEKTVFFEKVRRSPVASFLPLFELLINLVEENISFDERLFHCAIRVDPDMRNVRKNRNRIASSEWHSHDRDSYLFALTTNESLTTQIKIGDHQFNIHPNQLFLLPTGMIHKTPRPRSGKRIHLSIGVDRKDRYSLAVPLAVQAAASPVSPRRDGASE